MPDALKTADGFAAYVKGHVWVRDGSGKLALRRVLRIEDGQLFMATGLEASVKPYDPADTWMLKANAERALKDKA